MSHYGLSLLTLFQIINPIFILYKFVFHFFISIWISSIEADGSVLSWGISVILWVYPLVLISLLKVVGNVVSSPNESLIQVLVVWIIVQVLLSNRQSLELFHSVVVVSDLWESE